MPAEKTSNRFRVKPFKLRGSRRLLNLETSCTYFVVSLANQISTKASHEYRRQFGLGVMEWRCLVYLSLEGTSTAARIRELSRLDKALVSRALKKLESLGYVERLSDRVRPRPVKLTETGRELHDEMLKAAISNEMQLRTGLSDAEVAEFLRMAKVMLGNIGPTA